MAKITLADVLNTYNLTVINNNFNAIENEFQNKVLYRNNPGGEPNQMLTNLDMNSKRILNLPAPVGDNEPARKIDIAGITMIEDWLEQAEQAATDAENSATDSQASAVVAVQAADDAQAAAVEAQAIADGIDAAFETTISLGGPVGGESLRVMIPRNGPVANSNRLDIEGGATGQPIRILAQGVDNDIPVNIGAKGVSEVRLVSNAAIAFAANNPTGSTSYYHTTGAVDATGPVIEPAGSASDITANVSSKGNAAIRFFSNTYAAGTGREIVRMNPVPNSTNYLDFAGAVTGQRVKISASGTVDVNRGITYTSSGNEGHEFRSNGAIALYVYNPNVNYVNYAVLGGSASGTAVPITFTGPGTDVGGYIASKGASAIDFANGGGTQLRVGYVASAVNFPVLRGSSTGSRILIGTAGSDANRGIQITASGSETVELVSNGATSFTAANGVTGFNSYIQASGADSATARPTLTAAGPGAAIPLGLVAKDSSIQFFTKQDQSVRSFNVAHVAGGNTYLQADAGTGTGRLTVGGTGGNMLLEATGASGSLQIKTNAVERLRVDENGNLLAVSATYVVIDPSGHLTLRAYTVGTLPSASSNPRRMIYVSDGASNKRQAISDGTNWRWPDGAIVS